MTTAPPIALVTGANRGMTVLLGSRDLDAGTIAAKQIGADPYQHGHLDILINNAGIFESPDIRATFEVNLFGPWQTTIALEPLLRASEHGRVVNVSSGVGSFGDGLTDPRPIPAAYPVSKAALNALTVRLAIAWREAGVLINAACPGFIATFPGAEQLGARPVSEGAASIIWAATLPDNGPTGALFRDGKPLPW